MTQDSRQEDEPEPQSHQPMVAEPSGSGNEGTMGRITQGAIEAINGIIQLAKRRARGFRNFVYLRVIAYRVAGQLKANLPSYLPT